jgi:hypothetical protein
VVQGFGTGLAAAAIVNLAAQSASSDRTSVTVALQAIARTSGAAIGAQIAAAIIIGAGLVGGLPADAGFSWAFGMAAVASAGALAAAIAIPSRRTDPTTTGLRAPVAGH